MSDLISLQGYMTICKRLPTGRPGIAYPVGNVPKATLELSVDKEEKLESMTGGRGLYDTMTKKRAGRLTGTFDEAILRNLALGCYSTELAIASASVTGEELPAGLEIGDLFSLSKPFASSLVITDSTGSPVTVPSTAYEKFGHGDRLYKVKSDLSTYTEPLKAAYTSAQQEGFDVFSTEPEEVYIIFDQINTRTGQPVTYDIFRVKFDPFASQELINDGYGSFDFGADILLDDLNLDGNGKGGYYSMRRKVMP